MKETKRKAFNFLRSYFDVLNNIPDDSDKLEYLLAIINKSFLNEEPADLSFIAKLCYESQRHQVEKSVKGWITANKTDLQGDPIPPPKGDPIPPPKEEQEKEEEEEKVKEKEKHIPDYSEFKIYALEKKPNVNQNQLKLKYEAWKENGWKNGNNKKIKNWKSNLLNTLPYLEEVKTTTGNTPSGISL